jgi:tRNA(Ile)-lysidine synthase
LKKDIKNLWRWGHYSLTDVHSLIDGDWSLNFSQFDRLIVGFSGGLDSTVLLHALAAHPKLYSKLMAVHINHGISPNAWLWQNHCEQWCQHQGIPIHTEVVQFDRSANIEERARQVRYEFFSSLINDKTCLILAHHQDDQAETLLLQLVRGTGIDGLAAMSAWGYLGEGILARPFLEYSRVQLEHYAALHHLIWIEDESNQDMRYSRNYLRQQIMPLLFKRWPKVVSSIARTARHCQQAKNNLEALANHDVMAWNQSKGLKENPLFIKPLLNLNPDRLANILRVWLRINQVPLPATPTFSRLIHELLLARTDAISKVCWREYIIRYYQGYLYLDRHKGIHLPLCSEWSEFPSPLVMDTLGMRLVAKQTEHGLFVPEGAKLEIRFRKGGEMFYWHKQNKRLKKLFQEWSIPPWLREHVPLVYVNNQLAAVVGYAVSDLFFTSSSAWMISLIK